MDTLLRLTKPNMYLPFAVVVSVLAFSFGFLTVGERLSIGLKNNDAETNPALIVVSESPEQTEATALNELQKPTQKTYLIIKNGCGPDYTDSCVQAYVAPHGTATVVAELRKGVILPVKETFSVDSRTWHRITFDEPLRYPERLTGEWYVPDEHVELFTDEGSVELGTSTASTTKRIVVNRSTQQLRAYDGDTLFLEASVSTGLNVTPTPLGTFTVFRKTPSRYMQGPLPGISSKFYNLPGVPWNLYFTKEGAVIHGTYWHAHFGTPWSNGCVNLPIDVAETLYRWAPLGTTVTVIE